MAKGIDFPQANFTFSAPEGMEATCSNLPVFRDRAAHQAVSKWELSPAEIEEINRTGHVWLFVLGDEHPVVYVTGGYPFVTPDDIQQLPLPLDEPSVFERAKESGY